ncbi:MAG: transcription factor [Planctomycetales bacterium 12-60-4]|nr:MAG: transcription factor [Planctomycetales bacterium 12-60-4]
MSTSLLDSPLTSTVDLASERTLLAFDPLAFADAFDRKPFLITHRLCEHPLFDLDRLLRLAQTLPEKHIEYNAGTLPVNQDQKLTPRNGLSVEETVRRIRECKSWMVLKWVEYDPAYRALLEQCLSEVRPHSEPICPGMRQPQAFIFLTSPGSVTPYHIDPEHNFLLQVRGSKTVRLFDGRDPTILSHEELERFYGSRQRNMALKDENRDRCWTYELNPGLGLHFPVTFPHWVQNGDEVSVSFSITFRTPDLDRRRAVYSCNHQLRKWGFQPTPFGCHEGRDNYKYQLMRVGGKIRDAFRRDND